MTFYYSALFSSLMLNIHNINLFYNLSVRHIFDRHTNYMQEDCIFPFLPLVFDFYECDIYFDTRFPRISSRAKNLFTHK